VCVTGSAAAAQVGGGQVGYPPTRSPYVDLEQAQEITLIGGWFHGHRDPVNVGPQSGAVAGVHYEWRAGGPAHITAELARMSSNRNLINPFLTSGDRFVSEASRPLYSADVGLGLSLTGSKSWHHLVPEVGGGVGLISDLRAQADSGGFKFGTRFAFNGSAGLRYVPGNGSRWQVRGDIKDRLYTLAYPQTFYTAPTGGTAVLTTSQAKSFWTNNPTFTLGLSYLF
jgi:hypothetical protein